mgnify:FL=1
MSCSKNGNPKKITLKIERPGEETIELKCDQYLVVGVLRPDHDNLGMIIQTSLPANSMVAAHVTDTLKLELMQIPQVLMRMTQIQQSAIAEAKMDMAVRETLRGGLRP